MKRKSKFEIRRDKAKEWRWRFIAGNGQITAGPGEGYKRKAACLKAIQRHKEEVAAAVIVEASELDAWVHDDSGARRYWKAPVKKGKGKK